MNIDTLVRMANGIGQFFDAMPDRQEALDGVANHLRRYWEPRMREELLAAVDQGPIEGLHPLVAEALRTRRDALVPRRRAAPSPAGGSAADLPQERGPGDSPAAVG